jgi:hypothetical protein
VKQAEVATLIRFREYEWAEGYSEARTLSRWIGASKDVAPGEGQSASRAGRALLTASKAGWH